MKKKFASAITQSNNFFLALSLISEYSIIEFQCTSDISKVVCFTCFRTLIVLSHQLRLYHRIIHNDLLYPLSNHLPQSLTLIMKMLFRYQYSKIWHGLDPRNKPMIFSQNPRWLLGVKNLILTIFRLKN